MKRAALYARYSSEHQNGRSIDDQVALCRAKIEREGWHLVGVYSDREKSGATLHRSDFVRLAADAKRGAFDVIIAEDTDRIARGEGDMPQFRRQMEFLGIEIHTCADGHVTKLHAGLKGLMDSMYLDTLAHHVRRGMEGRIRDSKSGGGRAYGYSPVPGKPGELAIVPAEAEIVREIFTRYAAGETPRAVAKDLNARQVPAPRGVLWNASTINGNHKRGNGIILNALYAGEIVWNKVRMVKDPDTGKRLSRPNAPAQYKRTSVPALRIVDEATWRAAHVIKNGRHFEHGPRAPERFTSGLVRCGVCSGSMVSAGGNGAPGLRCSNSRETGACTNRRKVNRDKIETMIIDGMRQHLGDRRYLDAYIAAYNDERKKLARNSGARQAQLERRAGEIGRELARAVDAIVKAGVDPLTLAPRMKLLEAERDQVAGELATLQKSATVITLHPGALQRYRADIDQLGRLLADRQAAGAELLTAVRKLVASVVVHPTGAKGFQLEVKGRLGELTAQPLYPAFGMRSLVAEERYQQPHTANEALFGFRLAA